MGTARARKPRKPEQLALDFTRPTRGGKRVGAGRKRVAARASVPHRARPPHKKAHPLHVTMRAGVGGLRGQLLFGRVRDAIARASGDAFRVVHYSVQNDHVHLLIEAADARSLTRGMRGLAVRAARRINGALRRRGRVFVDRYHARELTRPRAVRNALVYVLMNHRKHGVALAWLDRCSSARSFDGWRRDVLLDVALARRRVVPPDEEPPAVARAQTWLGSVGWRRSGLLGIDESPRSPA